MKRVPIAAVLTVLSCLPLAHAETASAERLKYEVDYSDLNLSRSTGATVLYRRLQLAAERVCAPLDLKGTNYEMRHGKCLRSAIASAVAEVNEPLLTAYHQSKTGQYLSTTARALP